jgi:hypothetical protein
MYGHDVFYCPRTIIEKDEIFGEDAMSAYNSSYMIDMYIRSYESYEGDGQFLSKFGLEIRDQVTFTVSVRNFMDEIGSLEMIDRPQEGDLVYLPMADRLMYVKYVNKTPVFYQMGNIQMYDLVCEMFEYSSEKLNTGIKAIDDIERDLSLALDVYGITTTDGFLLITQEGDAIIQGSYNFVTQAGDSFEDNTEFETEGDSILDWTQVDPFSEGQV